MNYFVPLTLSKALSLENEKKNKFSFCILLAYLYLCTINLICMVYKYDFLIIGAGVAGMSYALKVARAKKGKVCIICKTSLDEANTSFAQGGVASVTNLAVDDFDKHIEDRELSQLYRNNALVLDLNVNGEYVGKVAWDDNRQSYDYIKRLWI